MRTSLKKTKLMAVEKLEENYELLIAILVRLPPKAVFKFRCVSKRWNDIFVDPYFLRSYSARTRKEQLCCDGGGRLLAFVQIRLCAPRLGPHHFMNILPITQLKEHKFKQFPSESCTFIHSSGGLILCRDYHFSYCVMNPITRTCVSLPQPNNSIRELGLLCEDNKHELVLSFRVVGISKIQDGKTMLIETYSSKSGKWTTSALVCTEELTVTNFQTPFVCNGVFHWCIGDTSIVVYDSNVHENYVQLMKLPLDFRCHFNITRCPSDDVLWVGTSDLESIKFWMLPKDEHGSYKRTTVIAKDEWILMRTIDKDSLIKDMTVFLDNKKRMKSLRGPAVNFLSLVALLPSNPFAAVLSLRQEMFIYNFESKSIELVRYRGHPFAERSCYGWHPYMEPLYLSTYAPSARAYE